MEKMNISSERAKEVLKWLLKEADKLRRYRGKPFLSKKDIKNAWRVLNLGSIYCNDILRLAEKRKIVFKPKMGIAEVNRIINSIIPQQRTGIKIHSMQWVISKPTKEFIYNLVQYMEDDDWLMKTISDSNRKAMEK